MTTATPDSAPARPVALPPYEPFPVDALPRPLAQYVGGGAAALGCDPAMIVLPAIAECGSVIGNTRTIKLKRSWQEPSVFWTCVIADSGTLKSPAHDLAVQPLHALQKRLKVEYAAHLTEYLAIHQEWKNHKAKDAASAGDEPEKPILPRVTCSDVTIEKLGELLEENPRGLLLAIDELNGWLKSFDRYARASSMPHWLKFHRAGSDIIDRKTAEKKSLFIDRAAVSVCGTIQPGIFAKAVQGDFLDSGLIARPLLAMPPDSRKRWQDVDIDPATAEKYEALLDGLYRLDFKTNGRGERVPIALGLDSDAKKEWIDFYNAFADEQHGAEGDRRAALSKLEAFAARFALLHHVCERVGAGLDDRVPIGIDSVQAGITLTRWFAREAERVYGMFGESPEQRETRRLTEFIAARGGTVTARELQRSNGRKYPNTAAAESALDALASAALGEWMPPASHGAGRPSKAFRLHGQSGANEPPPAPESPEGEPCLRI